MAKQLVNPIERHIEKGVLGIAGLLLFGVIGKFLIFSPNQMDLGGKLVSPTAVDQTVAQLAASVRQDLRNASGNTESMEPLFDEWLASLDPFQQNELALMLPAAAPIGPAVPIVDAGGSATSDAPLPEVFAFTNVGYTYGRSTFVTQTRGGSERHHPTNWVTVAGVFDVKRQMAEQRRVCGATRKDVTFAPPELQRRARRSDGSWSDDDWVDVKPWFPPTLPASPDIKLIEEEGQIVVSEEDQEAVEFFYDELAESILQLELLRPLLPDIANGEEWSFPVLTNHRDVLYQDELYLYPNDPRSANPSDRYGEDTGLRRAGEEEVSPEEQRLKDFAEIELLLQEAWATKTVNMALKAFNMAAKIKENRLTPPKDVLKATRLKKEANQRVSDIDRWNLFQGGGRTPVGKQPVEEDVRQPEPTQLIWAHDAVPGSVEGGKTYQYRLRAVIFNRLAGHPKRFRDPRNGAVLHIPGPWSDPMEVAIEPTTVFFAASKDTRKREIGIEFYKWFEGIWVKAREKFGIGNALSFTRRCAVPALNDPGKADRALVQFDAGLSVVDIGFDRPYRERKKGTTREGVKFGSATAACSIVFADADGRLYERYVTIDKGHPAKRQYAARVWKEPRK